MSGMGYGNMTTCASVNNWMVPGASSDPWTKAPPDRSVTVRRRTLSDNVSTSKPTDMYERSVISSTSPPLMGVGTGTEVNQSRLRSLLTRPKVRETCHTKEILKGLLKGQAVTTQQNTESNYLLKGLLSTGVKQQDDRLLGSLGFHSPSTCNPVSPQNSRSSPALSQNSPLCETSPLSYHNSPSPTGSSKRSADDDIFIERQIIKKKCYSPPSFHSLPSSCVKTGGKEGGTASGKTLCEKNKMLASLLATQPTAPATIPPLPQSVLTATPQERLPRVPPPAARTRQNSAAFLSGGTVKLNEPSSPPVANSPTVDEYLPPAPATASAPVVSGTIRLPVPTGTITSPEAFPVNTQVCSPVSVPSSPKVENCYQNTQQRNQIVGQQQGVVNQQMSFSCNKEETWQNYCGQQDHVPSTSGQDSSVWQEQITVQKKLLFQSSEDSAPRSNNYKTVTASQYNTNYESYEYYSQLQMRQSQNNNNAQHFLLQQQQQLIQQQQLSQQSYQQQLCALQKEYFNTQSQEGQQQMAGWNGYPRNQGASVLYNNYERMKPDDVLRQNYRGSNYQESRNSFQEYWDMQNSEPDPRQVVMGYDQNREISERKYMREGIADSTVSRELASRLSVNEEVTPACSQLRSGRLNEMQQMLARNPNLALKNDELQFFGENDNDLSRILDDLLDDENIGKNSQDPRRLQRNNITSVGLPTNGQLVHPTLFPYNNCNNYDAQFCA